jgi:hypothetical protein
MTLQTRWSLPCGAQETSESVLPAEQPPDRQTVSISAETLSRYFARDNGGAGVLSYSRSLLLFRRVSQALREGKTIPKAACEARC